MSLIFRVQAFLLMLVSTTSIQDQLHLQNVIRGYLLQKVYCSTFVLKVLYAHYIGTVILIFIITLYSCRKVLVLYLYIIMLLAAIIGATELQQFIVILVSIIYLVQLYSINQNRDFSLFKVRRKRAQLVIINLLNSRYKGVVILSLFLKGLLSLLLLGYLCVCNLLVNAAC